MPGLTRSVRSSFIVVGAGAAGTLVAARLLDEAGRRCRPVRVTLVDPSTRTGRGLAFSTSDDRHLLNVMARKMSAYPEDPDHFLRWAQQRSDELLEPCDYLPRRMYGDYLEDVLDQAQRRTPWASLHRIHDRAVSIELRGRRCVVTVDGGTVLQADGVALATGHMGPELGWAPLALRASPRLVDDPWAPGALDAIDPHDDVLVVGTGLTMVDTLLSLDTPGRRVHAVSRHGELPRRHRPGTPPLMEAPELPSNPDLEQIRTATRHHLAKATERFGDWRPAVDSIRSIAQSLWVGLDEADRAEFVALDARAWDAMRHRVPPASADVVDAARADGRLLLHTAHVSDVLADSDGLLVTLSTGERLHVGAVVNCTGPCGSPARSTDPLIGCLTASGMAVAGPLGLGFATTSDGRLLDAAGDADAPVWTIGSLRKGTLWESTAMPEIRQQAGELAAAMLGSPAPTDRRPVDRYDLPLSTSAAASVAWSTALESLLRLQEGAPVALAEAVSADPGFALGHATLALLGHEWGLDIDVAESLQAALTAAAFRADSRERSFVHVVAARLTGTVSDGDRELLRHVHEHPRDALAVSLALPTIAFSGVDHPLDESWTLVDRLAASYGEDWWFDGVRAFFAQERSQWQDAAALAERSLAAQPSSGHAAHALTHVYYETGEHTAGVAWLDGWMAEEGGRASYLAHFSWHAALHELALDDATAVRRRYECELAPPRVAGTRALVDSASLLWRASLAGTWSGPLPIDAVLASVPTCLLEQPQTPFAALHAAVAMAAAGDVAGIGRLERHAAGCTNAVFTDVVVPLCRGFVAQLEGRPADAVRELSRVAPQAARLGGSAAQQEIVHETLVHALVAAGRPEAAGKVIAARLDRRPSRSDRRRLRELRTPATG